MHGGIDYSREAAPPRRRAIAAAAVEITCSLRRSVGRSVGCTTMPNRAGDTTASDGGIVLAPSSLGLAKCELTLVEISKFCQLSNDH